MSSDSGNLTIATLVFGVLLAVGGVAFSAKYWMASSDIDRIRMIQENKDLTPSQKSMLVSMLTIKHSNSQEDRMALADYFQQIAFRLYDVLEEEKKAKSPRIHNLNRAAGSFWDVSETLRNPEFDSEKLQYQLIRAFTLLESANVTTEEINISKPPPINTNVPESLEKDANFSWTGLVLAIIGLIAALLAGLKAWFDFKKAQLELKKVQTEPDKALIAPTDAKPST